MTKSDLSKNKGVKGGRKGPIDSLSTRFRIVSKQFFVTYKGISEDGTLLTKEILLDFFLNKCIVTTKRNFQYVVCEEMYDSGLPHFHVILIFPKRIQITNPRFLDFNDIHPNIQILRNMTATLDYVYKEDPHPLTNLDILKSRLEARVSSKSTLYSVLQQEMMKNPYTFNVEDFLIKNKLTQHMYKTDYNKALSLIKMIQPAYAKRLLNSKTPLHPITSSLIEKVLSPDEISEFYSHKCYQKIVDHINELIKYPNFDEASKLPFKTKHLLIVGPSDIGKTSLVHSNARDDKYPGLAHYYATYPLSVGQRFFPLYSSYVYRLVSWEEFTIDSDLFPKKRYNNLLNYLDGSISALPQKGRVPVERSDSPKHILTSNRSLLKHINSTFNSDENKEMSLMNLKARIDCVVIPQGKSIHFLRKLFIPITTPL